jgi:CRISPR/Cas system CSM-associated protein Csm4 (group 5 of RAMP superfamily)
MVYETALKSLGANIAYEKRKCEELEQEKTEAKKALDEEKEAEAKDARKQIYIRQSKLHERKRKEVVTLTILQYYVMACLKEL